MGIHELRGLWGLLTVVGLLVTTRTAYAEDPFDAPSSTRATYSARLQVAGTRDEEPIRDLPQAITVVPRQLMDDTQARRTDDVLLFVPGIQLYHGSGGAWDDYAVRGFRTRAGATYRNGYRSGPSGPSAADTAPITGNPSTFHQSGFSG